MAQRSVRLSRPAWLGIAAIIVALAAAAGIYVAVSARSTGGYRMGVHFPTAAGIAPGALVYFNGVNIGSVSKVTILPDTTIDVILKISHATDIPRNSRFSVQTRFTGSAMVLISTPGQQVAQTVAPTPLPEEAMWPKRILPIAEQPVGTTPVTLEEFFGQGKALGNRLSGIMAKARPYGPRMIGDLQNARANAGATKQEMGSAFPAVLATLKSTMTQAQANIASAQSALQQRDRPQLASIATAFQQSARNMERAAAALQSVKTDPHVRTNLHAAAADVRTTSANMAGLSHDMEMVTGNAQTKAQLRDAAARFHDAVERLKSLL